MPTDESKFRGHVVGPLKVRDSNRHGLGVFTRKAFKAGDYVIAVRGCLITSDTEQSDEATRYTWTCEGNPFSISQHDVERANIARFINSSGEDRGNVIAHWMCRNKIAVFVAIVNIPANTELLCKYAF